MSFYNTTNLPNSQVRDPAVQNARNFHFIQRGYHQAQEIIAGATIDYTYTALQLIQACIVRIPDAASNDTTPTAADILTGLRADLLKVSNGAPYPVKNGFWWDFFIYNEGTDEITLNPGAGVVFGAPSQFFVPSGKSSWFRVTVTDVAEGAEEVYITQLSSPLLP